MTGLYRVMNHPSVVFEGTTYKYCQEVIIEHADLNTWIQAGVLLTNITPLPVEENPVEAPPPEF